MTNYDWLTGLKDVRDAIEEEFLNEVDNVDDWSTLMDLMADVLGYDLLDRLITRADELGFNILTVNSLNTVKDDFITHCASAYNTTPAELLAKRDKYLQFYDVMMQIRERIFL